MIVKKCVRRIVAAGLVAVMTLSLCACGKDIDRTAKSIKAEEQKTVNVWYCDELYTEYLKYVAQRVSSVNEMVRINPVLIENDSYIETIYNESIHKDNAPDVYLMSADELERASLLGVVAENNTYSKYYTLDNYGKAALEAATYKNRLYGYPVSFNTAFMIYNTKYAAAKSSFDEIDEFMNNFQINDENEGLNHIIAWDTSDMLLNFGFAAGSINIGGDSGDDSQSLSADAELLKEAMTRYQQFFTTYGIGQGEEDLTVDYCAKMFAEGSVAYSITDVAHLKSIAFSGVDYGVCAVPSTGEGYDMQGVSDTTLAVVNQYAQDLELAKTVAHILSYDYSEFLDESIGMLSAKLQKEDKAYTEKYQAVYDVYNASHVRGQFMGAASAYSNYEIMLNKISAGEDLNTAVDEFVSTLKVKGLENESESADTESESNAETENASESSAS